MNDSREPLFGVQDPRGEMIHRIRRETRPLGWAMLLYLILGSFVSVVLLVICFQARCMPELIESLTSDLSSGIPSYDQIVAAAYDALQRFITSDFFSNAVAVIQVVSVAIAILPICLFARKRSQKVKGDIPLKGVTLRDGAMMCAAMLGVNVFGSLGTLLTEGLFNLAGYSIVVDILDRETTFSYWVIAAYAVLIAPLVEEYVYRGVVLGSLRPYGEHFAVMASAVLFGLMHGNLYQLLGTAMLGYFLGYLRVRTGSWGICVLLHAFNNLYAVLLETVTDRMSETASGYFGLATWVLFGVLGAVCLIKLRNKYGSLSRENNEPGLNALINPAFVILMAFILYQIVQLVTPLA